MHEVRDSVIRLRNNYPELTLENIGKICGVTKQRAWYILRNNRLPTKKVAYPKMSLCKYCMQPFSVDKLFWGFCGNGCKDAYNYVERPCSFCGAIKKIRRARFLYKLRRLKQYNFFCNKKCLGAYYRDNTKEYYYKKGILT